MKTPEALRAEADQLEEKARRLTEAANARCDNAPGSFVTGRSGRTRSQNKKTNAALDNLIDASVAAVALRKRAATLRRRADRIENPPPPRPSAKQLQAEARAARKRLSPKDALFVGMFPEAYVYCDRRRESDGDYLVVALVSLRTLALTWRNPIPDLTELIERDVADLRSRAPFLHTLPGGQSFTIGRDYKP